MMVKEPAYLIWSNEHSAWWNPNSAGYTRRFDLAGHYTRDEAIRISAGALDGWAPGEPPPEIPVRFEDAVAVQHASKRAFVSGDETGDK